jgi:hypothetical protein
MMMNIVKRIAIRKRLWIHIGLGLFWGGTTGFLFSLFTKPHQILLGTIIGLIMFCGVWLAYFERK